MDSHLIDAYELSASTLHGWSGILLGVLGSVVFSASGRQDLELQADAGAVFWFFLAFLSAGVVIWLGFGARIWGGALLGVAVFCSEAWLIRGWWRKSHSA